MKVLVTAATGTVGSEVVKALLQRGADVRALTRKQPKPGTFPNAVEIALDDLIDPVSVAEAIKGADELFLLIGNVADEFTQALTAYGLGSRVGLSFRDSFTSPASSPESCNISNFPGNITGSVNRRCPYLIP